MVKLFGDNVARMIDASAGPANQVSVSPIVFDNQDKTK
jgi:hypothetical protein